MDINFAARQIIKRPVHYLVIILSLAIGMGMNTMVFSLYDKNQNNTLSGEVKDQNNLVWLFNIHPTYNGRVNVPYQYYLEYKENNTVFSDIIMSQSGNAKIMRSGDKTYKIRMVAVSGNYFNTLGIKPIIGRSFNPDEERAAQNYALISYRFWKNRFNEDPSVIGKDVFIGNIPYVITGIMPKNFDGVDVHSAGDVWVVLERLLINDPNAEKWIFNYPMARLRDGVNVPQASAEMSVRYDQLSKAYRPDRDKDWRLVVAPVSNGDPYDTRYYSRGKSRFAPQLLIATVLIMLLPCINVASLLMNRAVERMHELTIRAALGATRARIIRQLLTESLVVNLLGGCLCVLLFYWASQIFAVTWSQVVGSAAYSMPFSFAIDGKVIGYSVGLCVIISMIFGLLPLLHIMRFDLESGLKSKGMSKKGRGVRSGLICVEMAVSLAIIILAAPAIKYQDIFSQSRLPADNILIADFDLGFYDYTAERKQQIKSEIISRIESITGVRSAAAGTPPYQLSALGTPYTGSAVYEIDGSVVSSEKCYFHGAGSGYFDMMNISIIRGRDFFRYDSQNEAREVIINKSMAEKYWPNQEVIGKEIVIDIMQGDGTEVYPMLDRPNTIIGVVENSDLSVSGSAENPALYRPLENSSNRHTVLLRFANNESDVRSSIIREIRAIDEQLEFEIRSLKEQYAAYTKPKIRTSLIMLSLGIIMFIIAVTGMYAIAKDAITHRMREIGIRMMVGATSGDIAKFLIKSGVKIAVSGIAVGIFISWIASRIIISEVSAFVEAPGIYSYICVSVIQLIIMAAAWYFPIRKAINSEPMQLIKYE